MVIAICHSMNTNAIHLEPVSVKAVSFWASENEWIRFIFLNYGYQLQIPTKKYVGSTTFNGVNATQSNSRLAFAWSVNWIEPKGINQILLENLWTRSFNVPHRQWYAYASVKGLASKNYMPSQLNFVKDFCKSILFFVHFRFWKVASINGAWIFLNWPSVPPIP